MGGIFLSFVAYVLVTISFGTLLIQILVSAAGLAILCGVAYYSDWWKQTNKMIKHKRAAKPSPTRRLRGAKMAGD